MTFVLLVGFKPVKHRVFSGLYPADGSDFDALNHAIERLTCNDASVSVTKETSTALGLDFRYGSHWLNCFLLLRKWIYISLIFHVCEPIIIESSTQVWFLFVSIDRFFFFSLKLRS